MKLSVENIIRCIWFISMITIVIVNKLFDEYLADDLAILVILMSIYCLIRVKKNIFLSVIFIFILVFNYSICSSWYIDILENTMFTGFADESVAKLGINILFVFMGTISIFLPNKIYGTYKSDTLTTIKGINIKTHCVIIIILVAILIFGFGRTEDFTQRGSPSTIYEYSIIIFIIGIYFTNKNKVTYIQITYISLLILFALQNMIWGGRVTALQLLIALALLYFYNKKIKSLYLYLAFLFVPMVMIGVVRGLDNTYSIDMVSYVTKSLTDKAMAIDTAYSAYFTSMTFLKVADEISSLDRFIMFGKFIASMIAGGTIVDGANLAEFTRSYYFHYYGGVLPYFGWFYFGWMGVLLFAAIVSFYIKMINNVNLYSSDFYKCAALYICCSIPRWYLYSPSNLIRGVLILYIILVSIKRINRLLCPNKIVESIDRRQ